MTLYATFLWVYLFMASVVLGASIYETLVVHPAWSRKPPESFVAFMGEPIGRMNLPGFWKPVAPLYALSAVAALVVALLAGTPNVPLTVSVACAVVGVAWTLVYFRPNVTRFLEKGGGGAPPERLQAEARRWIMNNWIRTAMVAVSWWGVVIAAVAHR